MKTRSDLEIAEEIIPDEELMASQTRIASITSHDVELAMEEIAASEHGVVESMKAWATVYEIAEHFMDASEDDVRSAIMQDKDLVLDGEKVSYAHRELLAAENLGRQPGGFGLGPGGSCVCPKCGHVDEHDTGEPCNVKKCPQCGTGMTRSASKKVAVAESGDYLLGFGHGEEWRSNIEYEEAWPPDSGKYTNEEIMDLLLTGGAPRPTYPEVYVQGVIDGYNGNTETKDRLEQQGELFNQSEMSGM